MIKTAYLATILTMSAVAFALAADDHHHDGKHGGVMADTSGHHHVELVAKDKSITLYVLHDDGQLEDVTGAKATATILSGGKTTKVTLAPSGKGTTETAVGKGDTVVITLNMPGHKPEQARLKLD